MALTTFSDLVQEARERVKCDAVTAGLIDDNLGHGAAGIGAVSYADSVSVFLGLGVGRCANYWSSLTPWGGGFIVQTFGRQALQMVWDYAEGNPFSASTGNWSGAMEWIERVIVNALPAFKKGTAVQGDAQTQSISFNKVISTDPPYYDNIGYADLSDFFYLWLRRALKPNFPELFATVAVPKSEELVATPNRHGSKQKAEKFFLNGMTSALCRLAELAHPTFPVTIYYAYKQAETENGSEGGTASTGWDTFLEAIIFAGFSITGTWPMRTEREQGLKTGTNVLASSIILVCRKQVSNAPAATRREFIFALKSELPMALAHLLKCNIAPVDLAQAVIGPGMAIFTRYAMVIEADGSRMTVRTALQIINQELDTFFAAQEGDLDADTRFCLTWFEQRSMDEAPFGEADVLARAKNTSVQGLAEAGVLYSNAGKVRILKRDEYDDDWDPVTDKRQTVWECTQHLIKRLEKSESEAAQLVKRLGAGQSEDARALAYRLYSICERKKWSQEARAYNSLVVAWPEILKLAGKVRPPTEDLRLKI